MTKKLAAVWRWPLHLQIALGLAVGAGLGYALGAGAVGQLPADTDRALAGGLAGEIVARSGLYTVAELVGDLFLNALKLIIVPLVTSSILLAVAQIAGTHRFGRLGLKALTYYLLTSLAAVLTGLLLVNLIAPGIVGGRGILVGQDVSAFAAEQQAVMGRVQDKSALDFLDVFREMVPVNVFEAAGNNGKLLGLISVSLVSGYFLTKLPDELRETLHRVVQGVYELTLAVTERVLRLAPIGVAALVLTTVAMQWARLRPDGRFDDFAAGIGSFALVVLVALAVHLFVTLPLLVLLLARASPLRHFRAMAPALLTAFSTASSNATLPVTLECVERRAGVSNRTAGFVLPLGATVNMDGTALYECVAAMFICQAFGVELTLAQQGFIVVVAVLTSVGVAGVPAASLVAIAVILQAVEQQLAQRGVEAQLMAGMALLFVFDRPLDMCRTAVNIFSDSVGAVVIARSEGERPLGPGTLPA